MILPLIDTNFFWVALKVIIVGLLLVYALISFGSYRQIKLVNASLKTELSGLINFFALLRILGLFFGIILVMLS